MSDGRVFVYIGGIPRNGTMSCGAFLHLSPDCFIYMVMNGTHPPNVNFLNNLKDRHVNKQRWNGMQYLAPNTDANKSDSFGFRDELVRRNEWAKDRGREVFALPVLGVREDFASHYFLKAKEIDSVKHIHGRRVKLIFLVRRNIERLYYAQHDMKLQNQHTIKAKVEEFVKKIKAAYKQAEKAIQKYGDDVLIANVVDPLSFQDQYFRICGFLGIEPTPLMRTWMEQHPVTNTFGESVRYVVREVENMDFHKRYVAQ